MVKEKQQEQNRELKKYGRIAFITTPKYRELRSDSIKEFCYRYLYTLCHSFNVITTKRTFEYLLKDIVNVPYKDLVNTEYLSLIEDDTRQQISCERDLQQLWRNTIIDGKTGLKHTQGSFQGMIILTYELVEGRLDAVIHLTDWEDKSAKPDSAVLSREANVHDVPIATNADTAIAFVESWNSFLVKKPAGALLFKQREILTNPPLEGITEKDRVLAMVAHDKMKLELCRFAVEHAADIFDNYDYILATGETGNWLKKFMKAINRSTGDINKIRCCNPGPLGGDIQIANAVVKNLCHKVIFFQDPSVSHPHDSDIRLFEQAVVAIGISVKLANNVETAKLLI